METEMRLIDANALIKQFDDCNFKGFVLKRLIEMQPTVDTVEVVRCRECRWYLPELQVCGLHSESKETIEDGFAVGMDPDGFCSYGEIKREGVTGNARNAVPWETGLQQ